MDYSDNPFPTWPARRTQRQDAAHEAAVDLRWGNHPLMDRLQAEQRQWAPKVEGDATGALASAATGSPAVLNDFSSAINPVLSLFPTGRSSSSSALLNRNSPALDFRNPPASFSHSLQQHQQLQHVYDQPHLSQSSHVYSPVSPSESDLGPSAYHHHAFLQQHLDARGASMHQLNDHSGAGGLAGNATHGHHTLGGARHGVSDNASRLEPLQRFQAQYSSVGQYDTAAPSASLSPSWPQLPLDLGSLGGPQSAFDEGGPGASGLVRHVSDSFAHRQMALQLQQQQQQQRYGSAGGAQAHGASNDAYSRHLQQALDDPSHLLSAQQQGAWGDPGQGSQLWRWDRSSGDRGGDDDMAQQGSDNFSLPPSLTLRQLQQRQDPAQRPHKQQQMHAQEELMELQRRQQLAERQQEQVQAKQSLLLQQHQQQQQQLQHQHQQRQRLLLQQQQQQQRPGPEQHEQLFLSLSDPGKSASLAPPTSSSQHNSPGTQPSRALGPEVGMSLADVPARLMLMQQQRLLDQDRQQQLQQQGHFEQQQHKRQQQQQQPQEHKLRVRAHPPIPDASHAQSALPSSSSHDRSMKRAGSLTESLAPGGGDKAQLSHRDMEKQRRDRINTLIDELADIVPPSSASPDGDPARQRSKHAVLADALSLVHHILKVLPELAVPEGLGDALQADHSPDEGTNDAQVLMEDAVAGMLQEDAVDDLNRASDDGTQAGARRDLAGSHDMDVTCVQVKCSDSQLPDIMNALRTLPCEFNLSNTQHFMTDSN